MNGVADSDMADFICVSHFYIALLLRPRTIGRPQRNQMFKTKMIA